MPKRERQKPEQKLTREALERAALRYLDRFDTSAENLRRVLERTVRRVQREVEPELAERALGIIDELIERYRASGVLNDARYAENIAFGLRRKGTSRRAIAHKLAARGVGAELVDGALQSADRDSDGDAELSAARAFARRRRLGPYRKAEERAARRDRDLAALARAGFSFDVARRALDDE